MPMGGGGACLVGLEGVGTGFRGDLELSGALSGGVSIRVPANSSKSAKSRIVALVESGSVSWLALPIGEGMPGELFERLPSR